MKKRRNSLMDLILILVCILIMLIVAILWVAKDKGYFDKKEQTTVEVVKEKETEKKEAHIALTGDLLYEYGLYQWMDHFSFGDYLDEVKPLLDTDLTIANQEVPIGGEDLWLSGIAYTYNAPYEFANQYKEIGFDYVTNATNHTYDRGLQGVINTNKILDDNNIGHTGSYGSKEEADSISVVEVNGIKIAILAYTYGSNIEPNEEYVVNTFLTPMGSFGESQKEKMEQDVKKAQQEADAVFVALHWGQEFTFEVNNIQKEVAQYLNDLGVDLIIGNHPHTIQPADILVNKDGKETVVFYSLGNFISAAVNVSRASADFQNMYQIGALVQLDVEKEGEDTSLQNIKIIPVINHYEQMYSNFKLIPFDDYTQEMADRHGRRIIDANFNIEWLKQKIHEVFDDSGFLEMR